jgi:hypothetical protein
MRQEKRKACTLWVWSGFWLVIAVCAPGRALACACCDRASWRRVSGWDEQGNALIDALGNPGCSPQRRLEIWRPGRAEPKECVDLGTPNDGLADCAPPDAVSFR